MENLETIYLKIAYMDTSGKYHSSQAPATLGLITVRNGRTK
jgi:hypothetical protein